ncbi:pyrethroid hydrolase Ces2a-like [Oratosquilla oratoria]|uniref:pyrethroid hydrolase Ces2a-like n=1 Tax=Oratosquilla oratoria TaxID=337810 RepID=UPI003F76568A
MKASAFVFVVFASSWASSQNNPEDFVELRIPQGRLRGKKEASPGGRTFYSFLGLPFAKAPVGRLRLRDPEVWESWQGVLNATKQPSPCKQVDLFTQTLIGDENCLFLNAYTPQVPTSALNSKLPVLVFIHGGGFTSGSIGIYDPSPFMDYDVVVVLIQYRVGVLGFLSTRDDVVPGNFGLKDQTMALRWVQRHIAHFGGDPLKVTLFGESAGGASVHLHILSPVSAGLFTRAIMQSGTAIASWAVEPEDGFLIEDLAAKFNCSSESQNLLPCLQEADAEDIVNIVSMYANIWLFSNYFLPRADGKFLPERPEVLMSKGLQNDVDIISGYNKDEGAMAGLILKVAQNNNWSSNDFSRIGESVFNLRMCRHCYRKLLDYYVGHQNISIFEADQEGFIQLFTDSDYLIPHEILALHSVKRTLDSGRNLFLYEFRHVGASSLANLFNASSEKKYANHGDDLFYLFNLAIRLQQKDDLKMRDVMLKTWVNFASTGNPTPDESLGFKWHPASMSSLQRLILLPRPFMACDRNHEKRAFWNTLRVQRFQHLLDDESVNPFKSSSQDICEPL